MKKSSNKGFTLVELIIVIAILAIIMLIAIPNFSGIQQRMQVRADKATAAQIGKAVRVWMTDYTTDPGLAKPDTWDEATNTKYPTSASDKNGFYPENIGTLGSYVDTADAEGFPVDNPIIYTGLKGFVPEYMSGDSEPSSLLDGAGKLEPKQFFAVAMTKSSTNPEAKILVLVVKSASATTAPTGVKIPTTDSDIDKLTAGYDGTAAGNPIAYIEP